MSEQDLWREIERLRARLDYLEALESLLPAATGTWTPAWTGTGTAGVFTYTTQAGFYTLVGNLLFFWGQMVISAIGTPPVGTMEITGLPFTSAAIASSLGQVYFGSISNFNYTAAALQLTGFVPVATTKIILRESFDNAATVAVPAANFTNTACNIIWMGYYPL